MVEAARGLFASLDPKSLVPEGDVLEFLAPIAAVQDDDGRLLVLELEGVVLGRRNWGGR